MNDRIFVDLHELVKNMRGSEPLVSMNVEIMRELDQQIAELMRLFRARGDEIDRLQKELDENTAVGVAESIVNQPKPDEVCYWCGKKHEHPEQICPRVKAIRLDSKYPTQRIYEFWPENEHEHNDKPAAAS